MDLNRVTLIGRLTRDPEVRSTPAGRSVATITVATGRTWTDQAGHKQKESEFHNVVMWAKLADIAGQYLRKGARLYVEGRLKTRDWVGQDGVKRYRTEIVGDNMIMLDGPSHGGSAPSSSTNSSSQNSESSEEQQPVIEEEIKVEDIPF